MSKLLQSSALIGTDSGGNWYGFYEGLYDRVYRVPDTHASGYVETMQEICSREAIDVAVVSPEQEVLFWSERQFPVPTLLPSPRVAKVAISKKTLYEALHGTGLIPSYRIASRADLLARRAVSFGDGPVWLRDFSDASSSGLGAIKVTDAEQAYAWAYLNPGILEYMVAEFLPGRNIACCMLFHQGELLKVGCYERLDYFGGQLIVSGVSGNISLGRLINDSVSRTAAEQAIRLVSRQQDEPAHGLFTVDLREAVDGVPKITEINVRHTAGTSSLAAGGANLAEAQVLASLGRGDDIGDVSVTFADHDIILRDIDGPPLLLKEEPQLEFGASVSRALAAERLRQP